MIMTATRSRNYRKKRDLRKTPEPRGGTIKKNEPVFVIQKHDARRLHYDFRLNIDGSLVSWAIPKGLSTKFNEKRLAIRTEDHPLEYGDFEGAIPEGQYGGGTVMIWDKGTYESLQEKPSMKQTLKEGQMKFHLKGKKLQGGYAMARTGKRNGKEQWIIFKLDDEYADARRNPVSTEPDSVVTNRSLEEIAEEDRHE